MLSKKKRWESEPDDHTHSAELRGGQRSNHSKVTSTKTLFKKNRQKQTQKTFFFFWEHFNVNDSVRISINNKRC